MSYDYVRRHYNVNPVPGERVRHQITERFGTIVVSGHANHYVHVRFDGHRHSIPSHPTELDYLGAPTPENTSTLQPGAPASAPAVDAKPALARRNASTPPTPELIRRLRDRIERTLGRVDERPPFVRMELQCADLITALVEDESARYRLLPDSRTKELCLAGIKTTTVASRVVLLERWRLNAGVRLQKMKGAST